MAEDIPADVRDTLVQLLDECASALEAEDLPTARESVDSARTVATDDLPESDLRDSLLHGCRRIAALLDPDSDDGVEPDAAGEYVSAMQRRLPEE